jgi:predicted DNA-binding ribbon-helix-helix protein
MSGPAADRVQTGVRLERRLVKVLKALAEIYDLSLGELLERLVVSTFAGRQPFSEETLARVAELARIYRLDLAAMLDARAEEGRGGE